MRKKIPLVIGLGITGQSIVNYLSHSHDEFFLIEEWEDNPYLKEINKLDSTVHLNPKLMMNYLVKYRKYIRALEYHITMMFFLMLISMKSILPQILKSILKKIEVQRF